MRGERPERRERRPDPATAEPRLLESLVVRTSALFRLWLVLLALALGLVGLAMAYQLTTSLWAAPLGFLLGVSVALGLARDFVRWRLGPVSLVSALVFFLLFVAAQWLARPA
jgi:hypothetical protein